MSARIPLPRLVFSLLVLIALTAFAPPNKGKSQALSAPPGNNAQDRTADPSADLRLVVNVEQVGPPSEQTYAVHLKAVNRGPDTASQVTLLHQVLYGGVITDVDPADWSCTAESFKVTCQRPDLPTGAAPEVVVNMRMPALFNFIKNELSVSSKTPDPIGRNNLIYLIIEVIDGSNTQYALLPLVQKQP